MWLIGEIRSFGGWAFSISRKILTIAPAEMTVVVLATLASQIFRLFAFLLPIKIVLLIGSSGVPRYFPPFLLDYGRDNLVVWLGMATILFFVLHVVAEGVVDRFTERTADCILVKTDKLALIRNQDDLARRACRRFAETIAGAIFVSLSLILISQFHASVAILLTIWALCWFAGAAIGGAASPRFRTWLEGNTSSYVGTATSIGFFAVTGLIIIEFVSGVNLHILFAIISIILSRQALSRVTKIVSNALALGSRKLLINALFFRGHIWKGDGVLERRNVWELLRADEQPNWLPDLLERATGRTVESACMTRWHQTGLVDILAVEVTARHDDGAEKPYFVRMFGRGKDLGAVHEATLQEACGAEHLPAPRLLGRFDVEEFVCLVHDHLDAEPLGGDERSELRIAALAECWTVDLPRDLVRRYQRTHRLLHERLRDANIECLALTAFEPEQQHQIERLRHQLDSICAWLGEVPQALYNPDINADSLFVDIDERLLVADWCRWGVEPIGAGWPTNDKHIEALPGWLQAAQNRRPGLMKATAADARLVALLFAFEKALRKQKMCNAMDTLAAILAELDRRESSVAANDEPAPQGEDQAQLASRMKAGRVARIAQ